MELEKILVIEDNPKHLEDAKNLLEDRIRVGAIGEVDYTTNLEEAMNYLGKNKYTGVLSDVFFPSCESGSEEENGTRVGQHVIDKGLPLVLVTSTYHHGNKTQPVYDWVMAKGFIELIDANYEIGNGESESKDWAKGYLQLAYLIESKKAGYVEINSEGIKRISDDRPSNKMMDKYWPGMFKDRKDKLVEVTPD